MALAQMDAGMDDAAGLDVLLRQARERAGLRQIDLAAAAHVGESTYRAWEHGLAGVPAVALPLIAKALGVRFVADSDGWRVESQAPAGPVILMPSTVEAMHAVLDRLGVPRAQ